jgi:hypothetical protein
MTVIPPWIYLAHELEPMVGVSTSHMTYPLMTQTRKYGTQMRYSLIIPGERSSTERFSILRPVICAIHDTCGS